MNYVQLQLKSIAAVTKAILTGKRMALCYTVSARCNLRCKHCYQDFSGPMQELSTEDGITMLKSFKDEGIFHCSFIGGEPSLRTDLIEEALSKKIFLLNWIVTNGTYDLPGMGKNQGVIGLSVDGFQETHDEIRGRKGLYREIYERYRGRDDTVTTTTITRHNYKDIENIIKDWIKTDIRGVGFHFATATKLSDNGMLSWEMRDRIVDHLIQLKEDYGDFLMYSKGQFNILKKSEVERWCHDCMTMRYAVCVDPMGKEQKPCFMGEHVICETCGYAVEPIVHGLFHPIKCWGSRKCLKKMI